MRPIAHPAHPLAGELRICNSPSAILAVPGGQVQAFGDSSQDGDENLTEWLDPTINVMYAFSAILEKSHSNLGIPLVKQINKRYSQIRMRFLLKLEFSSSQYSYSTGGYILLMSLSLTDSQAIKDIREPKCSCRPIWPHEILF